MNANQILVNGEELEICHVSSIQSGYGHKKITVELRYKEEYKKFTSTTTNMPDYDSATELEGDEKNNAIYSIIKNSIADLIAEWITEVDENK